MDNRWLLFFFSQGNSEKTTLWLEHPVLLKLT
ncbi:hypothetical protein POKO110462_04425 [Pontibacter korlensis]